MSGFDRYLRYDRITEVARTARGLTAQLHGEILRVEVLRPNVLRLAISRGGTFDEKPTRAVCVDPFAGPVPDFDVRLDDDAAVLRTDAVVVTLGLHPFRLDVHRTDGSVVVESVLGTSARSDDVDRAPSSFAVVTGDPTAAPFATLNDAFTLVRGCRQEDAFYGLGEKGGRLNRKGRSFTLWNTDVLDPAASSQFAVGLDPDDPRADRTSTEFDPYYVSIPFVHHLDARTGFAAASFVDNGYRGSYDFTAPDRYRISFDGGQYTEYLFAGPGLPEILEQYTWLTGRAAPPPLWALGYHQCRWTTYTSDDLERVAAQHRADDIPCDALWLDIEYMDGYRVFTWDRTAFPDPGGLLSRLADDGFRVITIIDPGVKYEPGYAVFDSAVERDVLCRTEAGGLYVGEVWPGASVFPDFATPEARQWWGELNAAHVRSGLAGIWNDMNEPATGAIPPDRMRFDRGRASHAAFHNQYALLMAMGTTEGLRAEMPDLRTFVLSRAGFAGIQRYAANWMGDNQSRWDHLWVSMPMAAGFGLSGQPFVGADVGGFQGNSHGELFLRWMQYGALTPFFRNHSERGNVDQYAWSWGDPIRTLVREAISLRYRLLPYLYAAFLTAAETGAPVQRPLVFDHQDDATVRELDDEYLFGPDLLVAPVTAPGQTARQVYLPRGEWFDWNSRERHAGGRFLLVPTPMDRIPIYARAGAVIPMWPTAPASTNGHHPDIVELHVFLPSSDGAWTSFVQEDDGLTFAADGGNHWRTTFVLTRTGAEVEIAAEVTGNGYAECARTAFDVLLHGAEPETVDLDGEPLRVMAGRFRVDRVGTPFRLRFPG